jgi:hypothetical protein
MGKMSVRRLILGGLVVGMRFQYSGLPRLPYLSQVPAWIENTIFRGLRPVCNFTQTPNRSIDVDILPE